MSLAIFDLDDTLTMKDTESLWQSFLVTKGILCHELFLEKKAFFEEQYNAGLLNFNEVVLLSMEPISKWSIQKQLELQQEFTHSVLKSHIIPKAVDLVRSHYDKGHHVIIISAGHEFLIQPAAKFFPVHQVICTQLERRACGAYSSTINGKAMYREEKLFEFQRWLKKQSQLFETTYFYSDSINDLPLLQYVDIPVAVNPCKQLRQIALSRNWTILDLKLEYSLLQKK